MSRLTFKMFDKDMDVFDSSELFSLEEMRSLEKQNKKETSFEHLITGKLLYDDYGQYILDSNNNKLLEIKDFGVFKNEELQDDFAKFVVKALNKELNR